MLWGFDFLTQKMIMMAGSKNFKPQRCYTNPEDFELCPITALLEYYMTCFPEILQDTDGIFFPGAEQEDRFRKICKKYLYINFIVSFM